MQIEMTAVLEEMVATVPALPETVPALPETVPASPEIVPASPGSPDARDSTVLGEPPVVVKPGREKPKNVKRKLQTAFGDEAVERPTPRSRSRSPSPPLLLLPGAAVDKGKDAVDETRPSKVLRMQMRRKRQANMNGGSSAHNAAAEVTPEQTPERALKRTKSVYFAPVLQEEAGAAESDPETLLEQSVCSPRKNPFQNMELDFDKEFELIQMHD
jgi:hypothetical protein